MVLPHLVRECPHCGPTTEVATKNGPFTIWKCDGEPGDVWTAIDEDEMRDLVEESDGVVRWEFVEEDDGTLDFEHVLEE